jgi:hypothetical protein
VLRPFFRRATPLREFLPIHFHSLPLGASYFISPLPFFGVLYKFTCSFRYRMIPVLTGRVGLALIKSGSLLFQSSSSFMGFPFSVCFVLCGWIVHRDYILIFILLCCRHFVVQFPFSLVLHVSSACLLPLFSKRFCWRSISPKASRSPSHWIGWRSISPRAFPSRLPLVHSKF